MSWKPPIIYTLSELLSGNSLWLTSQFFSRTSAEQQQFKCVTEQDFSASSFRRINTHTWWDSLTFTSSPCSSSSHVSVSNKRDTTCMPQPGHSVCHYCFVLPLDFPAGALASERPLWHQPVINILNKPADGWPLSPLQFERDVHTGPARWPTTPRQSEWKLFFPRRE